MNTLFAVLAVLVVLGAIGCYKAWRWIERERRTARAAKQALREAQARYNISTAKVGFIKLMLSNECDMPSPEQAFWYFTQEAEPVKNPFTDQLEPILERNQAVVAQTEGQSIAGRTVIDVNRRVIRIFVLDRNSVTAFLADELNPFTPAISA